MVANCINRFPDVLKASKARQLSAVLLKDVGGRSSKSEPVPVRFRLLAHAQWCGQYHAAVLF